MHWILETGFVLKRAVEGHWILSILDLQLGILTEFWRDEVVRVHESDDIVEEAKGEKHP